MNRLKALIFNLFLANIWVLIPLLISFGLFADLFANESAGMLFLIWFINGIITVGIHVILFLPASLIYNPDKTSSIAIYKKLYPVLLIPYVLYVKILLELDMDQNLNNDNIVIIGVAGILLLFVHGINLYTFIHQYNKNQEHEIRN